MGNDRVYCSDLCLASGEPMLGTATRVDVWLLLEYRPVWRAKAVEDNDLATATKDWIDRTVAGVAAKGGKARVQFVRRPELDMAHTTLFVAESGTLRRFEGEGYAEIQHLDIDAAAMDEVHDPQYFVCTNGQRDLCCARYGLPVYAALRALVGERAWQTTHLGGHRFAPNVLTLPQGAIYGRVFVDDVAEFTTKVENNELSTRHLRGRSVYPPEAQVAETLVDGILESIEGGAVTFQTAGGLATVDVEPGTPYEVIASCGRTETEAVVPLRPAGRPRPGSA